MEITMAVEFRFSGGQFNTVAGGSIGGQRSDTLFVTNVDNNIFDDINRAEALIGRTEFRCLYVYNTGGGHVSGVTLQITINPVLTQMSVGLDTAGRGDGRTSGIATSITQEDNAPAGVHFFGEENTDDGNFATAYDQVVIPIGLLKSGEGQAVWFKRKTEVGPQQVIAVRLVIKHDAVSLPGDTADDGGAIGELTLVVTQATGTYKVGTMRVGFMDLG